MTTAGPRPPRPALVTVSPWCERSGAPICALRHAELLRPDVSESILALNAHGILEDDARAAGLPVWCVPFGGKGFRRMPKWKRLLRPDVAAAVFLARLRYAAGLASLVRQKGPGAIVHVHSMAEHLPWTLLGARRGGARIFATLHEPWQGGPREERWARQIAQAAEKVVFLSRDAQGRYPACLRDKSVVVPNAMALPSDAECQERAAPRDRRAQDRAPVRFSLVGRLYLGKGVDIFLRACGLLKRRGIPFQASLVGGSDPAMDTKVRDWLRTENLTEGRDVLLCGERGDMPAVYADTDILVSASRRDSFPRVIMEAMGYGLPVVATAVDGVPEMVADGQTGILVPSENPEAMADAIARMAAEKSLRRQLGDAGRQRARTLFDPAAYRRNMLALYGLEPAP